MKNNNVKVLCTSGDESFFHTVKKGTNVMIGTGEHAVFIKAGESSSMEEIDSKLDKICNESNGTLRLKNPFGRRNK